MKKIIWIVFAVIIILLLAVNVFLFWSKQKEEQPPQQEEEVGIEVFAPAEGEEIYSPFVVRGIVKGNGWTGFEGQVGTVTLYNGENQPLAFGILTATTDWMRLPTRFEAELNFFSTFQDSGKLVFKNENAEGSPERDREFVLPVKIAKTLEGAVQVKLYFNNNKSAQEYLCSEVLPVDRTVESTAAIARAALEELLKGPTRDEILGGYFSSINPGVKIQKLTIQEGVAEVDFDSALEKNVGGSCRTTAIRNQITKTLLQFPTVKDVVISIDGRKEDILQP